MRDIGSGAYLVSGADQDPVVSTSDHHLARSGRIHHLARSGRTGTVSTTLLDRQHFAGRNSIYPGTLCIITAFLSVRRFFLLRHRTTPIAIVGQRMRAVDSAKILKLFPRQKESSSPGELYNVYTLQTV